MIALLLLSLVSPADLEPPATSPAILDARPSMKDYLAGHVPGAQWVGPDNWRSTSGGVPGEVHPEAALRLLFGRLGLHDGDPVVVYGAANDPDAALVASVLRMHGFDASILDGGFERWTREGRPVVKDLPRPAPSRPKGPRAKGVFATYDEVLAAATSATGAAVLDVRPPEQFEAGRIPGAVSMFWKRNLRPEDAPDAGSFRNPAELREAYRALGVTPDRTIYVYCNSGHMAAVGWFVLREVLGYPDVRLYDGSWIDWSSRPGSPRASGKPGEARARAAADALTRDLQARLVAELREGGPARAVAVCAEVAPRVAAEHSGNGVVVRRVTLKPRNPSAAPDDFEREVLERWAREAKAGTPPAEVVREVAGERGPVLRYLRPISVGSVCLHCHGPRDKIAPEVRAVLEARYPDDRAVDYAPGELRGAVSVTSSPR